MDKGDEWENSHCTDVWLHRYIFTGNYIGCVEETCEICGDVQYFSYLPNGTADNLHYLSYHLRQALPRSHPLYAHEYL